MKRILLYLLIALLTFLIGVSTDAALNRVANYFLPDTDVPGLGWDVPPVDINRIFTIERVDEVFLCCCKETWPVRKPRRARHHN